MKNFYPVPRRHRPGGMDILYEDEFIYVINKYSGVLSCPTRHREKFNALDILTSYMRRGNSALRKHVFPVHRLDRDTSGVMVFAKTYSVQQAMKEVWRGARKFYLAAVEGRFGCRFGKFDSVLAEDTDLFMHSVDEQVSGECVKGKRAVTEFAVLGEAGCVSIVKVKLVTGRKNQIRVHFSENGHPLLGDVKYNPGGRFHGRLCLHSKEVFFLHPCSGDLMHFDTAIPDVFMEIAPGFSEEDWESVSV